MAETIRAALTKANASDRNQALSLAKIYVVPAFRDRGLRLDERALSTTFAVKDTALAPIYNVVNVVAPPRYKARKGPTGKKAEPDAISGVHSQLSRF